MLRFASCLAVVVALASTAQAVDIETVPVGNPGNAADMRYNLNRRPEGFGRVDYNCNIGKYEVTNAQYAEFLNAVADADPNGLYNTDMGGGWMGIGGISRTGEPGVYEYTVRMNRGNRPVNYISWYDAAMFCNWLTSGDIHQGAYDTSVGAGWGDSNPNNYTGIMPRDSAAMSALVGTYGTVCFIPTEDEWYKAAYYDGDTSRYYSYPTGSHAKPGYINDAGNFSGTGNPFAEGGTDPGNYATWDGDDGTFGIGPDYYLTEVGEHENSASPYGTFDQGGNIFEWTEAIVTKPWLSYRLLRGGCFGSRDSYRTDMHVSRRAQYYPPADEHKVVGFRVASIPEPGSITLLLFAALGLLACGWRKRRS